MSGAGEAGGGAFSRRGAAWLAALGVASLTAAGFLGAFGDALYDPPSFGNDGFSRSAVGHRAFLELLRGLGFQVVASRPRTAEKGSAGAVVALLEPQVGSDDAAREGTLAVVNGQSRALLVVLPKREPLPDPLRPQFVGSADLLPLASPQRILDLLQISAKVVRPERTAPAWRGELPAPSLDQPQLILSETMKPLLASDDGILVGEIEGWPDDDDECGADEPPEECDAAEEAGPVAGADAGGSAPTVSGEGWHTLVVADPDLLATHGLGRGDNAVILVRALERFGAGRVIAVDETLHGLEQQPSLVRELLRFPLLLATASALFVAALLAWAALVRFGRPTRPEPLLKPGRLALVESTAGLLRHGGHFAHAAAAYLRAAKERVAQRLQPLGEGGEEGAWLMRIAEARGKVAELRAIEERVRKLGARKVRGEEAAVRTAQAIHRWREEMTDGGNGERHGADGDPRPDRAAQG